MNRLKLLEISILIFTTMIVAHFANATNRYVRSGATGSNSGSDWANAFQSLPASLVRGDTYYIADGTYAAYTFDDPTLNGMIITIKKATLTDHGTELGWLSSYGDGQAIFNSVMRFERSDYVLDGQVRNEANWFDGAAYGFRINHNNQDQNIVISNYGVTISNIQIKYVFIDAILGNLPSTTVRRLAVDTDGFDGGTTATKLLFHRMFVRGSNNVWFLRTTEGAIVEYSASEGATSNSANHGEIVNLYYSGNNAIIRYNQWRDAFTNGDGGTALVAITYADGLQFYGNVLYHFAVGDGAVGFDGYYTSHNRVYNNTFVNSVGYNAGVAWGSGTDNLTYNNLYINCPTVWFNGTHDNNGFSDGNNHGEAHAQINISTGLFNNFLANDFTLKSVTNAGLTLSEPFNKDPLGRIRGSSGIFNRGAYEYGSLATTSTQLVAPKNLRIQF